MLRKIDTRYDSPLLMLLNANRARRRTLMITKSCMLGQKAGLLSSAYYKGVGKDMVISVC